MRNPFVAVDTATDLRARAQALRRSWESTMGGGPSAGVRPVIERSWRRLTDAGLDPGHLHPRRAFEAAALDDVRAASPLRHVMGLLRGCLGRFADDAEHVMVVVDATGRILWIEGHPGVRGRAEAITFREGMEWTEDSAGTNAIGTALAIEHAVQVFSAEHFLPEQHEWWCSAAPVHDPVTRELLGIVDLSGPLRTAHPHSLALVVAAAGMAEEALSLRRAAEDERLRRAFLERSAQAAPRGAAPT
ncbi:MAG TPA: GAF domain-containing protein, partial [Solirubrobacteraceae bacterium]|nr:GAF domain-containing protein [Solirubrobacteraceae bacterium]